MKITIRIVTPDGEWALQRPLPTTCSPASVMQALVDALVVSAVPVMAPRLMVEYIPPRANGSLGYSSGNFIECVKAARTVGGLSLRDAKDLCDEVRDNGTPREIKPVPGMTENEAIRILTNAGMSVARR